MLPGMSKLTSAPEMEEALEGDHLKYIEAMILSMTLAERRNPDILNGSRRKRIARGSGTTVEELNQLLKQFAEMRTMMRQISTGKGPWAQFARQYMGGNGGQGMQGMQGLPAGMAGMPDMGDMGNMGTLSGMGMPQGLSRPHSNNGKKKTGKAARKERKKQKAKSGRR